MQLWSYQVIHQCHSIIIKSRIISWSQSVLILLGERKRERGEQGDNKMICIHIYYDQTFMYSIPKLDVLNCLDPSERKPLAPFMSVSLGKAPSEREKVMDSQKRKETCFTILLFLQPVADASL